MQPRIIENSRYEVKIEIQGESHSFPNLLRKTLLEEPSVEFAGYHIDHPLLDSQTKDINTN